MTSRLSALRRMRVARWSSSKSDAELVRVLDRGLHVVEQGDLAVEEALVAAGQVHVQVADALLQQLGLLLGDARPSPAGSC